MSVQFLNVPMFRNVTLQCLTEIASVTVSNYDEQFVQLITQTTAQLEQVRSGCRDSRGHQEEDRLVIRFRFSSRLEV